MPASDDHDAASDRRRGSFDTLTGALGGLFVGHALASVARFGVADALDDTPRTAEELAEVTGADPEALRRVLRLLVAHGVFAASGERFTHTGASRMLRCDHPQSWRDFVATFGTESTAKRLGCFDYTLRTGLPATNKANPDGFFAILRSDPEAGRVFDAAMVSKARIQVASVLAAYDFSHCATIADIGGGRGHLLRAVLEAAERSTGVLFDLPAVIERAAQIACDRLTLQAGDFFTDPLPVCDTYLLMDVIHDWDAERATAILAAVRKAAPPHARLLLVESVIPDDPGPHWSKAMDIVMLIHTGGRQRTRSEHESLLQACGFRLERVVATASDVSIIEAVCA
jgi:O-methyltransferase